MILLGFLSVIQIVFLPGYIVARSLHLDRDGAIKTWLLAFPLSLVINHFMVVALVVAHAYTIAAVYFIFGVELLLLTWMELAGTGAAAADLWARDRERIARLLSHADQRKIAERRIARAAMISALFTIFIYLHRFSSSGHIFTAWDAVVSWNRWAVEWYQNKFPTWMFQYPQLLPTNMSLTYAFMGDASVQLFAKMIMPLFPLTILLAIGDLGLRLKHFGLILSITTTAALLLWLAGDSMDSGLADLPMASMAFAALYMLLLSKTTANDAERRKALVIGAVLAGGAALTKQPGICLVLAYPVLAFLLAGPEKGSSIAIRAKSAAILYATSAIVIAPWYLFVWLSGIGANNLQYLASGTVHGGRSGMERMNFALGSIADHLGRLWTYLLVPLGLIFGAADRTWRWLLIGIVAPWFFAWVMLFSYDMRNLALAIPFAGVITGVGLYDLCRMCVEKLPWSFIKARWRVVMPALAAMAVLAAIVVYPDDRLIRHQIELQKLIGYQRVNNALYEYEQSKGFSGKIATRYQFLGYLPGLKQYYVPLEVSGVTLDQFLRTVQQLRPAYFLWQRSQTDPQIDSYVRAKIDSRQYGVIFNIDGFELIELAESRNTDAQTPSL